MRRTWVVGVFAAIGFLAVSGSVLAHHGDAGRYNEEVIVVQGTVLQVQLINPHSMLVFEVTEPDGKKTRWQAELQGGQGLVRNWGWTPNTLKPGTAITVTGRRPKSGAPYLNLTERANVVLTDSNQEIFRTENYGEPAPSSE